MEKQKKKRYPKIDFSVSFAVAVCISVRPGCSLPDSSSDYASRVMQQLSFFDSLASAFRRKKYGREFDRNSRYLRLLCHFPLENRDDYADLFLKPLVSELEEKNNVPLLCSAGLPAANHLYFEESLTTAKEAFELFFFEPSGFFEYQKDRKRFEVSFEDYEIYSENAFKSILFKAPDAIEKIDSCIELIKRIHYGNKNAVIMRAMNYTGETAYRLHRYNLLGGDFYKLQDTLQEKVLSALTFNEMKDAIHTYYVSILTDIYSRSHTGKKTMAEQVKTYIRENYMNEITVEELAGIACVSPGYFSHMFKNETGENYKSFLISVRLDSAAELLVNSDYRIYEISDKVGYKNVRNFVEAFKKKYKVSPSEYRKNCSVLSPRNR